jgi:outer membrane protein OmpA-like peptidoglycan-associated protein
MEGVRASPAAQKEGAKLAPQQFAHADDERALANQEARDGDPTSASLHAARAIAAYTDAIVLARLARASTETDDAKAALARDEARAHTLSTERAEIEREADELEKKLQVSREALAPVPSGHADPEREAARRVAARSLAAEGRLLCGAARLLSPSLDGLEGAEKDVDAIDAQLDKPKRAAMAPIDGSARARAACLGLLSRARRSSDATSPSDPDALLSELSASGAWDPTRDERGVVVTLRDVFKGTALTPTASKALAELGRVAAAHPSFAVQVVVHDAIAPSAAEAEADAQRARAVAGALVAGGAAEARVKPEAAGARAPIVDPSDARHRSRNARVEVVFVSPVS